MLASMDVIARVLADIRAARPMSGRINEIAEGAGLKPKTLRNLLYGVTADMRHANARKLMDYYAQFERRSGEDRRK